MSQIGDLNMQVWEDELLDKWGHTRQYINKCIVTFRVEDCKFSPKQLERFKFLVGPRLNEKTGLVKFSIRQFSDYQHNYNRAVEMITETLLESYRAPVVEELPDIREVVKADREAKAARTSASS